MGAQFLDLLKKVTIFMLAGQIIVQFLPSGGYEKYVKMMISIMVLSQIALPILSLGKFDAQQTFQTALRQYEEEMERISRQVEEAGLQSRDYQQEALSLTARNSLEEVSAQYGVTVTAVSRTADGRLALQVSGGTQQQVRIEKVEIPSQGQEEEAVMAGTENTETAQKQQELREAFAEELGIAPEELEVIWNG